MGHGKARRTADEIVKNRCKHGDFYWVEANVTTIYKNGKISEYMSVRKFPTPDQIKNAEALYQQINAGEVSLKLKGISKYVQMAKRFFNIKVRLISTGDANSAGPRYCE